MRIGRQEMLQLRTQEINQQRNQQAPGEDAAGKIQRRQLRSDNIAHADVGRADRGAGKQRDAAGGHRLVEPGAPSRSELLPSVPTGNSQSLSVAKKLKAPARKTGAPNAML